MNKEEAEPGQMQAPDFTTSAFKSSMTLTIRNLGTDGEGDGKLHTSVAGLHCEISVSLAASKRKQQHLTSMPYNSDDYFIFKILIP